MLVVHCDCVGVECFVPRCFELILASCKSTDRGRPVSEYVGGNWVYPGKFLMQ
jgi:hypothetical protein